MGVSEKPNDPESGSPNSPTVANRQPDQSTSKTKLFLGVLFVVAVAVIAIVASVLLLKSDDKADPEPTSPYEPNPAEVCDAIAQGSSVPNQDSMISKVYDFKMDVSLTSELLDPTKVVEELQSKMQSKLGPKFADCPRSRRLRLEDFEIQKNQSRELLDKHNVGNVLFDLQHDGTALCKIGAPSPCIVVDGTMILYLKGEQNFLSVLRHVSTLLEEDALVRTLESGDEPFVKISVTDLDDRTVAPTLAPTPTPPPTTTPLYPPNTSDDCAAIAQGLPVSSQDVLLEKTFDVRMDVSLTLQLSDLSEVVEEMEARMQRILAPEFGDCRARRNPSSSIERNVVGNVKFRSYYQPGSNCDASAPTPCIRVLTRLTLWLKGEEDTLPLANHITEILAPEPKITDVLGLTAPFNQITVVGVTSSAPTLYVPNSSDDCARIARGEPVATQDLLIMKAFDIRMDMSMTLLLSDISEVVEVVESRMQQILGPELADCGLEWSPFPGIEQNVIGNARFESIHQEDQSCDSDAPAPCHRILTRLTLMLKGEEETLPLENRITGVLGEMDLLIKLGLTAPLNVIQVVGVTATSFSMTPTSSPTTFSIYGPNSAEACTNISNRAPVLNQDAMVLNSFVVRMDVSLTLQLSDLSDVVTEMERRFQLYIAPKMAECSDSRRLLGEGDGRKLFGLERNVVGNVQFFLEYKSDQSCDYAAPIPCIRVLAKLNIYTKAVQDTLPLANHITMVLGSEDILAATYLTAPFAKIEVVGVTSAVPSNDPVVPGPTFAPAPTFLPGPTPAPMTMGPVTMAPTPIPPSSEDCIRISNGLPVAGQDEMVPYNFSIQMSVLLILQLPEDLLSEVVDELESRMQRILAPKFANCHENRRLGESSYVGTSRKLLDNVVIGNAEFQLVHQESESCYPQITAPCIRVVANTIVFLKEQATSLSLISKIATLMSGQDQPLVDVLGLAAPFEEIQLDSITSVDPTLSPTIAPTTMSIYESNTPEECETIAQGLVVAGQEDMASVTFDILMDVSLTLQLSDLAEVVEEVESRLQRIVGPQLADCAGSRRLLLQEGVGGHSNTNRSLLERNVIANALFVAVYDDGQCDSSAPTPCFQVSSKLRLWLKGEEQMPTIIGKISEVLGSEEPLTDVLGLTAPFSVIRIVNLAPSAS